MTYNDGSFLSYNEGEREVDGMTSFQMYQKKVYDQWDCEVHTVKEMCELERDIALTIQRFVKEGRSISQADADAIRTVLMDWKMNHTLERGLLSTI